MGGIGSMIFGTIGVLSAISAVAICWGTAAFETYAWIWMLPVGFLGSALALAAVTFLFAWICCALVRLDVPQEKDSPFYRKMVYALADAIFVILQMRLHTQGLEKTPKQGRFLLVCNHIHDLDPVTLFKCFKKSQLAFISKRENSSMFLVGKLMHKTMCQLINRENDREALKTIIKCVQLLQNDQVSIAVFPEGYTSLNGKLHPFRSGVFKIAQKAKVPIVVCTLKNTNHVFHNAKRLKPTDVHLHLLDVLYPETFAQMTTVQIGEKIHAMMAEDLGPDLVHMEEST